jgi:hypothetical protein
MPRRELPPPKDFAFDFTADWSPYAAIVPGSEAARGWTLHGTLTRDGKTYGLAHNGGMYAACDLRGSIWNLTAIERSRISTAVVFKQVPGLENAPKKPTNVPIGLTGPAVSSEPPEGYSAPRPVPEGACDACGSLCHLWKQIGERCERCSWGIYQPAHCWHFVRWPMGHITATPVAWITEEDVKKLNAQHADRRLRRGSIR